MQLFCVLLPSVQIGLVSFVRSSYRFLSRPESNRKRFRCPHNSARKIKKVCFPRKIKGCGAGNLQFPNGKSAGNLPYRACQPYVNPMSTLCQPYVNPMSTLSTTRIVFTESCKMRLLFFGNLANFPCSQDTTLLRSFPLCFCMTHS